MTANVTSADPEFISVLKSDIQGMYWSEAAKFTPEQIEREYRNIVQDHKLRGKEGLMSNLMFMVRKREVTALRDDVFQEYRVGNLPPEAVLSAAKTVVAIGGDRERETVDRDWADKLRKEWQRPDGLTDSRTLDVADRVGGEKTLAALNELYPQAQQSQKEAETAPSPDFEEIKRLDRIRSAIATKRTILEKRLQVQALGQKERMTELASLFVGRQRFHEAWAYKALRAAPADDAIVGVRAAMNRAASLVPQRGLPAEQREAYLLDARLRAVCLLEELKAALTVEEQTLLADNADRIRANESLYRPAYDWEDVLDRR